jgi:HAD superfamily hydrolase (TIGR01509 family)
MEVLKKNDIEICLLSNALPLLADTGSDIVKPEYSFTSYKLGLLKPDPLIYQTVQQKLGVEFNQLIFIDDKEKNVLSAQNLGIHGIVYKKETIIANINSLLSTPKYNQYQR